MPRVPKPWYRRTHHSWYVTVNGKQHNLGVPGEGDDGLAKQKVVGILRELGVLPQAGSAQSDCGSADPDAPVVRRGPVAELVAEYLPVVDRRLRSAGARENYRRYLNWLAGAFAGLDVAAVSAAEVERRAGERAWTTATRRLCFAVVAGFMRWCGRTRFKLTHPPMTSRGAEAVISPAEFAAMVADARGDFAPALRFMHLTGTRPGEMRTLTCDMVDWLNGVAEWKDHKTSHKGKKRVLPMGDDAMAILLGQREKYKAGHLFRNRSGEPFSAESLKFRMKRLRNRVGARKAIICYSMRHTAITEMLEAGVPVADVAALSGHSSPTMVEMVYSHVSANTARLKTVANRRKEGEAA